ncbi:MAG: hypothetical protein LBD44_01295 [Spirochaetaceae bacterium]|jgi:hypothetical protein|nr:hypothetical protein [Spirochaetaceae bacterium]
MKKRKNERAGKWRQTIDILVIIFCIAGAAFAFFLFWRDLNKTLTKQNEAPIAIISFKQKTAQRRFGDRTVWDLLKQDSPIYSRDVIHTADLAEATVFFSSDEASVNMSENSQIQVFDTEKGKRIELSTGAVSINTGLKGAKLVLVSSGTEVDMGEGSVVSAVSGAAGNGAGLQIIKGSVDIITADGIVAAGAGDALALSADGHPLVFALVSLLTPAPSAYYVTNNDGESTIVFSWNTSNFGPDDFVRFQISSDQRFSNVIESSNIHNSRSQTMNLAPGTYWWRVSTVNADTQSGIPPGGASELISANKFTIVSIKAPETISPAANSAIRYNGVPPSVRFQWSAVDTPEVRDYMLQAADNPQMQNPAILTQVRGDSFSSDELGEGTWYWQVRPIIPENWEGSLSVQAVSDLSVFTIRQIDDALTAPVLNLPMNAAFVNIGDNAESTLFSWKNESSATSYTLEIADNINFNDPLFVKTVTENRYVLNLRETSIKNGLNFWRVSYVDGVGDGSPPSAARYFEATETALVFESVSPPDSYNVLDVNFGSLRFQWQSNLKTPSAFRLARDRDFSSILIDEITTDTSFQEDGRLGRSVEGTYFWKVANSFNGNPVETSVRSLTVQATDRVVLEAPPSGTDIAGLTAFRGQAELRWSSGAPLTASRLQVSRAGITVLELENPGMTVTLPSLAEGTYTWTVQAETIGGFDISPEVPYSFRVMPIPLLPEANGLLPTYDQSFGPDDLRSNRSIGFAWNPVVGANGYIFRLYREGDPARPIVSTAPLRSPSYTISDLTLLDVGLMVWQVEAVFMSPTGTVEQRGQPAESRFSIDISLPSAPMLHDEETYGR